MTEQEIIELKKTFPRGWQLKADYTDPVGNKWSRGRLVQTADGEQYTPPPPATEPEKKETKPTDINQQLLDEIRLMREKQEKLEREVASYKNAQPTIINPQFVSQEKPFGVYTHIQRPKDDFLKIPKTYVMRGKGYVLSEYMKEGQVVLAPYNQPLYFERMNAEKSGDKVIYFCQYKTQSKAESEFIENSPYFGLFIFKSIKEAGQVNVQISDKIEGIVFRNQNLDQNAILAKATALGFDIRKDEGELRAMITKVEIEQEYSRDKQLDVQLLEKRIEDRETQNSMFKNGGYE